MGWLITLGILIGISLLPLGVSAVYDSDGFLVRLIAGPFRLPVYPRKMKAKKKKNTTAVSGKTSANNPRKQEKSGGSLKDFLPLLRIILDFISSFKRKLRVNKLEMKLILGGDDPCDLAVNYGRAWTGVGNLIPQLERLFVIKERDIKVECDFTSTETRVIARLDLTITLGRVLSISVYHGFRAVRAYLNILKLRKGGAKL